MNKVILSGNLTRDPEVRYTQSGMAYARMGIAVSRPYVSKNNTEGQTTTDFFNMTSWGKQAEFCGRYLKKGSSVIVEGRIENNNYEDKNGVKHYDVAVSVERIEFGGSGSKRSDSGENSGNGNGGSYGNNGNGNYENNSGSSYVNDTDDVDVPF